MNPPRSELKTAAWLVTFGSALLLLALFLLTALERPAPAAVGVAPGGGGGTTIVTVVTGLTNGITSQFNSADGVLKIISGAKMSNALAWGTWSFPGTGAFNFIRVTNGGFTASNSFLQTNIVVEQSVTNSYTISNYSYVVIATNVFAGTNVFSDTTIQYTGATNSVLLTQGTNAHLVQTWTESNVTYAVNIPTAFWSNGTNHANAISAACSNLAYATGTAATNYANARAVACSNLAYAIGTASTNYADGLAVNATNYAASVGTDATNFAYSIGANATNFAYSIGANATSFVYAVAANTTNFARAQGTAATNYTDAASLACSNLSYSIGTAATNFSRATGLEVTNLVMGHWPTNQSKVIDTNATSAAIDWTAGYQEYRAPVLMKTNLSLWPTNLVPGREIWVRLTAGNGNYDVTLTNLAGTVIHWNLNSPTNGTTSFTVTNGQRVELAIACYGTNEINAVYGHYR